jgi:hypothetical protein
MFISSVFAQHTRILSSCLICNTSLHVLADLHIFRCCFFISHDIILLEMFGDFELGVNLCCLFFLNENEEFKM